MGDLVPDAVATQEKCRDCGGPMYPQSSCQSCLGEDKIGGTDPWCPACAYCCGC